MVRPFSRSKRQPVRLRHKIAKAGTAKQRKLKKEAKRNPQWKSRLKKDPGIPNLFPFKEKILEEVEEKKRKKAEDAQRLRDAVKSRTTSAVVTHVEDEEEDDVDLMEEDEDEELLEEADEDHVINDTNPMAALLASARARAVEYDGEHLAADVDEDEEEIDGYKGSELTPKVTTDYKNPDSSRRAFDKIFKQVLEASDVVLYVLDARDPDGTRSREVERQIMSTEGGSKRLILILNKIDLVPPQVLKGWLKHLRRYFPTIPLRASTPASNAHTFDHKQLTVKGTSETLLNSLKSYSASKSLKRSITVGVIGYPNVGKSSVINTLASRVKKGFQSSSACPVGSEAGITTSLREVKIDNKLKILDSPGIVFPSTTSSSSSGQANQRTKSQSEDEARLILLNALPPSQITDPIPAINLLLSRLSASPSESLHQKLLDHYSIPALGPFNHSDTTTDFLVQVARKRGRLGRGGVPNLNSAAMAVITDWRDGRIQGWMEPPVLKVTDDLEMENVSKNGVGSGSGDAADRKEIVKEWAAEFRLDGLWGDDDHDGNQMQVES